MKLIKIIIGYVAAIISWVVSTYIFAFLGGLLQKVPLLAAIISYPASTNSYFSWLVNVLPVTIGGIVAMVIENGNTESKRAISGIAYGVTMLVLCVVIFINGNANGGTFFAALTALFFILTK